MNLGIVGESIERVAFDYAVTLLTDGGAEIRIETTFSLRTPGGEVVLVDPEKAGEGAEQMSAILHEMITYACVGDKAGTFVLEVVNGTRLDVAPNESYEAWTFTGSEGLRVVAQPGGGVTSWGSDV